jgi:hypothetical protein
MGTAVDGADAPSDEEPASTWLFPAIACLLVVAVVLLFFVSIVLAWPMEWVGNGFQLLGLALAALGVPVAPPQLAICPGRTPGREN